MKMEGGGKGEFRKKLRSFGSGGSSSGGEETDYKESEGLAGKRFDLKQEAKRQEEVVEYLRRKDSSLDGLRELGKKTLRLLGEIYKIAETRGEPLERQQIPSLSMPYLEVITAVKKTVEGLIDDVEDVKNTVLSQRKATTMSQTNRPQTRAQTAAHSAPAVSPRLKKRIVKDARDEEQADEEVENQQDGGNRPRLRRKRTRIMCQNCLEKPRNSVILRCKHSLLCPSCLTAGKECISNCTGCGKDISDFVVTDMAGLR